MGFTLSKIVGCIESNNIESILNINSQRDGVAFYDDIIARNPNKFTKSTSNPLPSISHREGTDINMFGKNFANRELEKAIKYVSKDYDVNLNKIGTYTITVYKDNLHRFTVSLTNKGVISKNIYVDNSLSSKFDSILKDYKRKTPDNLVKYYDFIRATGSSDVKKALVFDIYIVSNYIKDLESVIESIGLISTPYKKEEIMNTPKYLYHSTRFDSMVKIFESNKLIGNMTTEVGETEPYVCFSYNPNFIFTDGNSQVRLAFDAKALYEKYDVVDFHDVSVRPDSSFSQFEKRVYIDEISNIKDYLTDIKILPEGADDISNDFRRNYIFGPDDLTSYDGDISSILGIKYLYKNKDRLPLGNNVKNLLRSIDVMDDEALNNIDTSDDDFDVNANLSENDNVNPKYSEFRISEGVIKRENDNAFARRTPIDWNERIYKHFDGVEDNVNQVLAKFDENDSTRGKLLKSFEKYKKDYFNSYNAYITHKANNPSWAVTGRAGRSASKDAKSNDRYNKLMLSINDIEENFKKTLTKYNSIAKTNKVNKTYSDIKDYVTMNPLKGFPFKTEQKEVPSLNGTAIKRVPTLKGYFVSKDWGSYSVYSPDGKVIHSCKTTETQANAKEWLVYYLYKNNIDALSEDSLVDSTFDYNMSDVKTLQNGLVIYSKVIDKMTAAVFIDDDRAESAISTQSLEGAEVRKFVNFFKKLGYRDASPGNRGITKVSKELYTGNMSGDPVTSHDKSIMNDVLKDLQSYIGGSTKKASKVVTNVIREDNNYRVTERNGAYNIQVNNSGKWSIYKEHDQSFSRLTFDKVKSYYALLLMNGDILSFKSRTTSSEDVLAKVNELFTPTSKLENNVTEPVNNTNALEDFLLKATGTKPSKFGDKAYEVYTENTASVHSSIRLSKSLYGSVILIKWDGDGESFRNFCLDTDIFDKFRKVGYELKADRKTMDNKFIFSNLTSYKNLSEIDTNTITTLQKKADAAARACNELITKHLSSKNVMSTVVEYNTMINGLSNFDNIVKSNDGYVIFKENKHVAMEYHVKDSTGVADTLISLKYMNIPNIADIVNQLTGFNTIVSDLGFKYDASIDKLVKKEYAYDPGEMDYHVLIWGGIKQGWFYALDYFDNIMDIIEDDLSIMDNFVDISDSFKDMVVDIVKLNPSSETKSDAVQFDDLPTGSSNIKLRLKVGPKRVIATIELVDIDLTPYIKSKAIDDSINVLKALGFVNKSSNGKTKFILNYSREINRDLFETIWEDIQNSIVEITQVIREVGSKAAKPLNDVNFQYSTRTISSSGGKANLTVESKYIDGNLASDYISYYEVENESGEVMFKSPNHNLGSSLSSVLSRSDDIEYLLSMGYYKAVSEFINKLSIPILEKGLQSAKHNEDVRKADAWIKTFKIKQDDAFSTLKSRASSKDIPYFTSGSKVYLGLPLKDIASVRDNRNGQAVYNSPNLLSIAKPNELAGLFNIVVVEGTTELLPGYVDGMPYGYSTSYVSAYSKAVQIINDYKVPTSSNKYRISDKLTLKITIYDSSISGSLDIPEDDVDAITKNTNYTIVDNKITKQAKNRAELINIYKDEFNRLNVEGTMAIGEIIDGRVENYGKPYIGDPTILDKVNYNKTIGDFLDAPKGRSKSDLRNPERLAKVSMVKDVYHKEQLLRLVDISKKLVANVEDDSMFNSFFLEEPKEFKKYRLPTVALALTCYDLSKKHDDLKLTALHKLFSKARGIVSYGRWFSTTDPDGNLCKMSIWIDREFEKKAKDERGDDLKALRQFDKFSKLNESIGKSIEVSSGLYMLLESVDLDGATFYDGVDRYDIDLDDIDLDEDTQSSDVQVDVKDDLLRKSIRFI